MEARCHRDHIMAKVHAATAVDIHCDHLSEMVSIMFSSFVTVPRPPCKANTEGVVMSHPLLEDGVLHKLFGICLPKKFVYSSPLIIYHLFIQIWIHCYLCYTLVIRTQSHFIYFALWILPNLVIGNSLGWCLCSFVCLHFCGAFDFVSFSAPSNRLALHYGPGLTCYPCSDP